MQTMTTNDSESICNKNSRCIERTCWSTIKTVVENIAQGAFDSIGFGASENIYQCALYDAICASKHEIECPHLCFSAQCETVAPITSSTFTSVPCGFMRSDIIMKWQPCVPTVKKSLPYQQTRKRKAVSEDSQQSLQRLLTANDALENSAVQVVSSAVQNVHTAQLMVIEIKATRAALNGSAAMQLMAYMRSYRAAHGLLCNFVQKCEPLEDAIAKQSAIVLADGGRTLMNGENKILLKPQTECIFLKMSF